jgi:prophage regulatory protein
VSEQQTEIDKFVGRETLRRLIRCHDSTIYRLEQSGQFPRRMRIAGRVYWSLREILAWMDARKAARETLPPVPPSRVSKKMIAARAKLPRTPRSATKRLLFA